MNCEACGHDWWKHREHGVWLGEGCEKCFWDIGPCYPWEFR